MISVCIVSALMSLMPPMPANEFETVQGEQMEDGFRGQQVCSIVGITYRQLDYWARTDLLRPSITDAKGSGTQRRYSYTDLVELKVIKMLLDGGIALQSARLAVEYLRKHMGSELASANLVISGGSPILVRGDGEMIDLVRQGQGVLNIVPLGAMVGELDARIMELRLPDVERSPGAQRPPRRAAR